MLTTLGSTRSSRQLNHLLQTPDTFIRSPLPGLAGGLAIIHAAPAMGARFTQYTVEFEPGGALCSFGLQRLAYVLEGSVSAELDATSYPLAASHYFYSPAAPAHRLVATSRARVVIIEKPYEPVEGVSHPQALTGDVSRIQALPLGGDSSIRVTTLLPDHPSFDFAVNVMTFEPGASLWLVEVHLMEHGLLMLAGGGIYRLGEHWYPVMEGDFIWMAPYCPQWFGALGKTPAKYLLFKDWNRHPGGART